MLKITGAVLAAGLTFSAQVFAADAPAEIKIGTLYASSGRYASISMPVHSALKLWIDQKNADGGVYVKAFGKKVPTLDATPEDRRKAIEQLETKRENSNRGIDAQVEAIKQLNELAGDRTLRETIDNRPDEYGTGSL